MPAAQQSSHVPVRTALLAALGAALALASPGFVSGAQSAARAEPAAAAVARRVQDRDTGRDSRMLLRMKLVDRRERVRERALELLTLRGASGNGSGSAPGDRLLIRFTYPNDIRGTGFLVWEHAREEDERFLYLPALGRVRRIAGSEAQDSFVGSDFTYEDIGGREYADYTYAFAGPDGGNASWTPPSGGAARPAWRLESTRKDPSARYPRVVSLVLKDSLVVASAEIYNRRGEQEKAYSVRGLERIEGIWTVTDAVMTNLLERTRTELAVERASYNVGLNEADFSRRELERGAAPPAER